MSSHPIAQGSFRNIAQASVASPVTRRPSVPYTRLDASGSCIGGGNRKRARRLGLRQFGEETDDKCEVDRARTCRDGDTQPQPRPTSCPRLKSSLLDLPSEARQETLRDSPQHDGVEGGVPWNVPDERSALPARADACGDGHLH
jgi:hypothetical protein